MKTKLLMLTAVMSCAFAGQAMAMTKEEYKAQGDRISADYKAGKDKCGTLKDNAKDICVAEAKGAEKVAKAEREAQYKPSPRNDEKLAVAKGDAAYDVAKEKCDDLKGNDKDVCVKDAKAAHVKAKENAKVAKPAPTRTAPTRPPTSPRRRRTPTPKSVKPTTRPPKNVAMRCPATPKTAARATPRPSSA
jgi:hypothetical protein